MSIVRLLTIPSASTLNGVANGAADRQIVAAGAGAVPSVVYGEVIVTGRILNVLQSATGSNLVVQVVWSMGPILSVDQPLYKDRSLPSGATVTHCLGTSSQAVDATMVAAMAAQSITYASTLAGIAYSVFVVPVAGFDGSLKFTARVRGLLVYDPRKDSTVSGGSGSHRLNNSATWEYSDNPALAYADWLRSPVYGCGVSVDWVSVIAAANHNDAMIGTPSEKRRIIGLEIDGSKQVGDVEKALSAYAGVWGVTAQASATSQATKLVIDSDATAAASYSHSAGQILKFGPLQARDISSAPTAVEVVYTDTSKRPIRDGYARASVPGAGSTLPLRLSQVRLPGISRYSQALREATERLNKLRLGDLSAPVEWLDEGVRHEVGDIINLTHPVGVAAKPFRIASPVEMISRGRWRGTVVEHDPAVYSNSVQTAPSVPDTNLVIGDRPPADWTNIINRPADDLFRNNLVDTSWWSRSATLRWTTNGEVNSIISTGPSGGDLAVAGPRGGNETVWYCAETVNDGNSGGGWDVAPFVVPRLDPSKTYRFVLPVRRLTGTAYAYWGVQGACDLNSTTSAGSQYFAFSTALSTDRWYLFVGYVYPYGSTGNTNDSAGIWDCRTGLRVAGGDNWNHSALGVSSHRAYQYYASNGATQLFGKPFVNLADGTEPSLREYFENAAVLNDALLPSISSAQSTANAAQTAAASASSAASAAQTSANTANAAIADSAADDKLSPVEKQRDIIIYNAAVAEKTGVDAEADRYGITTEKTAYGTAHAALVANVGPLLADLTTTSNITGSQYRGWFSSALNTKQTLLNRVAEEAGKRAQWASVTGSGRPADNATVNRVTYSATAPTSPVDGDIWVDTSSAVAVIRARVSSAWQVGANLTTNTSQLTDGAGLGQTALWPNVSGSGRPADNATRNVVTRSSSPPGSPADGDLWADTSISPATWRVRVSGAWQIAANYTTNTNQLADGANLGQTAAWAGVAGVPANVSNATVDVDLVGSGAIAIAGNTVQKTGGVTSWDASCRSRDGYAGGAFCGFVVSNAATQLMVGLNTDPASGDGWESLDYALYCAPDGTLYAAESGALHGPIGTYIALDPLLIAYDGFKVRYFKAGTVLREVSASVAVALYLDSSFAAVGSKIERLRFGPLSSVGNIATTQLANVTTSNGSLVTTGPQAISVSDGDATSGGATATASVSFFSDGTSDGGLNYYLPTTSGIGASLWLRITRLSGATPSGITLGAWTQLNSTRTITLTATNQVKLFEGKAELSTSSSGSPIVAAGTISLYAESYSGSIP